MKLLLVTIRGLEGAVAREAGVDIEGPVSVRAYVYGRCFPTRVVEFVASREIRHVAGVETRPSVDRPVKVDVDC